MSAISEAIESSSVITSFQEQFAAAQKAGDSAGMAAAHAAANAYRETVGGYTHDYSTSNGVSSYVVNVKDTEKYNTSVDSSESKSSGIITVVGGNSEKLDTALNSATETVTDTASSTAQTIGGTITTAAGVESSSKVDTYLGYAIMLLVIATVLKKVF